MVCATLSIDGGGQVSTRVVIGRGPDGLRAAAARATAGGPVLLLQLAATPTGRTSPELPEGTGRMDVPAAARARVEAVVGYRKVVQELIAEEEKLKQIRHGTARKLPGGRISL